MPPCRAPPGQLPALYDRRRKSPRSPLSCGGRRASRAISPWGGGSRMFDGHVALITGGTRGIGGAITTMLAENGARVAAGYSRGKEVAEALQRRHGDRVSVHQGRV